MVKPRADERALDLDLRSYIVVDGNFSVKVTWRLPADSRTHLRYKYEYVRNNSSSYFVELGTLQLTPFSIASVNPASPIIMIAMDYGRI